MPKPMIHELMAEHVATWHGWKRINGKVRKWRILTSRNGVHPYNQYSTHPNGPFADPWGTEYREFERALSGAGILPAYAKRLRRHCAWSKSMNEALLLADQTDRVSAAYFTLVEAGK